MRYFAFIFYSMVFCYASAASAKSPTVVPQEALDQGWIALFNGTDLTGWEIHGATAPWTIADGTLTNVGTGLGWLGTTSSWGDFELLVEWKLSAGGNSSIYYRAGQGEVPWYNGYDVQLRAADEANPTGSVYDRLKAKSVPVPDEQWHTAEIRAEGNRHQIKINGEVVVDGTDTTWANGRIGLQMHDASTTVQFRKVWIRPLGLSSIFNGQNLEGWRVRKQIREDRPAPDFRVEENAIRIQGGPGYLETQREFADFHARFKVKTTTQGGAGSNSGVFIRGPIVPGDNFTIWPEGLEIQIYNQPADFTTGGIVQFAQAAGLYAQDDEWFWLDMNVVEDRYNTWVNGMPGASWTDPENRFLKGILALQANDPKSVTYFGSTDIVELAPHTILAATGQ